MSESGRQQIRELIHHVRARWHRLMLFRATVRAALAASSVLAIALALALLMFRAPLALALLGVAAAVLGIAAILWGFWRVRSKPTDAQVARFIEETDPSLDDRLASAVDLLAADDGPEAPALSAPMMADAGRRASTIAPASVLPGEILRRAGLQAAAA